jgi:hypothetical protein
MSTIVGVEAIRLYSGRAPGAEQYRKYHLALQEIRYLAANNGVSETATQKFLLRLILKSRELPEPAKLALIDRLTRLKADAPAPLDSLTPAERAQVGRWLKHFIVKIMPPAGQKLRLQELRERLTEAAGNSG